MSISSVSDKEENKSFKDRMMDTMDGLTDKPLNWADYHPSAAHRKARRIFLCCIVIILGVGILWAMSGGAGGLGAQITSKIHGGAFDVSKLNFSLDFISKGDMMNIMVVGGSAAIVGLGFTLLFRELISKKYQRTAGKVLAAALPFLMLGAGICLLGAGLTKCGPISAASFGNYGLLGMLLMGGAFITGGLAIDRITKDDYLFKLNQPIPDPREAQLNEESEKRVKDDTSRRLAHEDYDESFELSQEARDRTHIEMESMDLSGNDTDSTESWEI